MASFIFTFINNVDLACPSKSRPSSFSHLPKPPWASLIYVLLVNLSLLVVIEADRVKSTEEHRHRGALYLSRGKNIHTLSWVVEVNEGCSISSVIGDIRKKNFGVERDINAESKAKLRSKFNGRDAPWKKRDSFNFKSCGKNVPLKLMVLKELTFPKNTYVIAHPYLKLFLHTRRRWKSRYKRSMRSFHLAHTFTSAKFGPRDSALKRETNSSYQFSFTNMPRTIDTSSRNRSLLFQPLHSVPESKVVFQNIEMCVEKYLASHPCVNFGQQEILRPRKKRGHVDFADPLYEKQWHLVSSGLLLFRLGKWYLDHARMQTSVSHWFSPFYNV